MAKTRPQPAVWYKGRLFKSALLLALVAAFLGAIIWTGRWGLENLRGKGRYEVAFTAIECDPPAGLPHDQFLEQVQYYARLADHVNLLDDSLQATLSEGFAKHPWVEKVVSVEIQPPKRIRILLTYRTPVLAVRAGDSLRAVDGAGVLLPANAPTRGLPIFDSDAPSPVGDGKRWGDPNVEDAARKLKK